MLPVKLDFSLILGILQNTVDATHPITFYDSQITTESVYTLFLKQKSSF